MWFAKENAKKKKSVKMIPILKSWLLNYVFLLSSEPGVRKLIFFCGVALVNTEKCCLQKQSSKVFNLKVSKIWDTPPNSVS